MTAFSWGVVHLPSGYICQNSYGKWTKNIENLHLKMVIFYSYVSHYRTVQRSCSDLTQDCGPNLQLCSAVRQGLVDRKPFDLWNPVLIAHSPHSYWTWPFIVSFPTTHGDFHVIFHSHVRLPEDIYIYVYIDIYIDTWLANMIALASK